MTRPVPFHEHDRSDDKSDATCTTDEPDLNKDNKDRRDGKDLCEAVKKGDKGLVKDLIRMGIGVNCLVRDRFCMTTPLLKACEGGNIKIVKLLVNSGASINQAGVNTLYGITPILAASSRGHTQIVKLLVSQGADQLDEALGHATKAGHTNTVEALLQAGAKATSSMSFQVQTKGTYTTLTYSTPLLIVAVDHAHPAITKLLLQWGAHTEVSNVIPVNSLPPDHSFYETLPHRRLAILKLLLLHGCDIISPNLTNSDTNVTAFTIATKHFDRVSGSYISIWNTRDKNSFQDYIFILYVAGGYDVIIDYTSRNRHMLQHLFQEIRAENPSHIFLLFDYLIRDDKFKYIEPTLTDFCRRTIRGYLICPIRGKQKNLITVISLLPLPKALKKFLLLDLNIHEWIERL